MPRSILRVILVALKGLHVYIEKIYISIEQLTCSAGRKEGGGGGAYKEEHLKRPSH
jgi:hypothetical protein